MEFRAHESKLLEYFEPKKAKFADTYTQAALPQAEGCWWQVLDDAKLAAERYLDVAQLVKHYLGLSRSLQRDETGTLLYLFWEPLNWMDVPVCRQHRDEVEELA